MLNVFFSLGCKEILLCEDIIEVYYKNKFFLRELVRSELFYSHEMKSDNMISVFHKIMRL